MGVGAFYLTFSLTKKAIVYGPLYERKESGKKHDVILCHNYISEIVCFLVLFRKILSLLYSDKVTGRLAGLYNQCN